MLQQVTRIENAHAFARSWFEPFSSLRPSLLVGNNEAEDGESMDWMPAEGWCTDPGVDPLGTERLRHDIALLSSNTNALEQLVQKQALELQPVLQQPATVLNQAERLPVSNGHVRIVNKVATVLAGPLSSHQRPLEVDEESEFAAKRQTVQEARRTVRRGGRMRRATASAARMAAMEAEWEDLELPPELVLPSSASSSNTPANPPKHQQPPSILSLRGLQRRWLPLGYAKNKVGTALGLRYAQPWTSSHFAFTTGRIFSVGANNRRNDRGLVKHATVPYVHHPLAPNVAGTEGSPFGAYKRISQNIVASLRLRPGETLCLGLLFKRLEGYDEAGNEAAKLPPNFKSVVLSLAERRATLLVYRTNIICVGTSSLTNLIHTYEHFQPMLQQCEGNPANLEAEEKMIYSGALEPHVAERTLNYEVDFDPVTGVIKRVSRVTDDKFSTGKRLGPGEKKSRKRAPRGQKRKAGEVEAEAELESQRDPKRVHVQD